jgi:hypothetical protein
LSVAKSPSRRFWAISGLRYFFPPAIGLDPAGARHGNVHHHDLRIEAAEKRMRRGGVGRLADHHDVALPLQQARITLAHHGVIIHQQHAYRVVSTVIHLFYSAGSRKRAATPAPRFQHKRPYSDWRKIGVRRP